VTDAALRAKVAATALAGGAHYLDPGGDEAFRARLACAAGLTARAAVLAAGAQPGLTALVPRWLAAQDLEPPFSLTVYTVTMDWMTRGAAAEFLLSLGDGQPGALTPLPGLSLPFLSGELVGHPHLSGEAERLARCLSLTAIRCYHVFEVGGRLPAVLTRLQQDVRQGADPDSLTAELIRAAEIEMFGRRPFQQLVFQLDGRVAGQPASRVAVLRAAGTYQLTASVAAAAVVALLRGQIPAGCHFVADVLDPVVVGALPGRRGETSLHLSDRALAGSAQFEQGRL
jgi:hypothetical protein